MMLDEVRKWSEIARVALAAFYRDVRHGPENLPFKLIPFASFPKKDVVLEYIERAQRELTDLTILSLFATFEQLLLDHFESSTNALLNGETEPLKRRILEGQNQLKRPRETPIKTVLDYYKAVVDPDLVGQVKQIYQYRNWVAHGKRGPSPPNITPVHAYSRLKAFLDHLR